MRSGRRAGLVQSEDRSCGSAWICRNSRPNLVQSSDFVDPVAYPAKPVPTDPSYCVGRKGWCFAWARSHRSGYEVGLPKPSQVTFSLRLLHSSSSLIMADLDDKLEWPSFFFLFSIAPSGLHGGGRSVEIGDWKMVA
ncbi:hypothetical protein U1Q18_036111 [Sarracenia purpurea var. burkii]